MVTRLAWMAHRLQSSNKCTAKSSVACTAAAAAAHFPQENRQLLGIDSRAAASTKPGLLSPPQQLVKQAEAPIHSREQADHACDRF